MSNRPSSVLRACIRFDFCLFCTTALALAQVSVLTANYDNQRTNANVHESVLKPSNVNPASFGKIASFPVDGQIYAQPLYAAGVQTLGVKKNVVYVATMHNSVYAIDADAPQTNLPLWLVNLGPSVPSSLLQFDDIRPEVGILSTPVIDLSRQVIYVVSDTLDSSSQKPVFRLHALSLANGHEVMNGPVTIGATVTGSGAASADGAIAFDASMQLQRPGLALANGAVYLAFGSHADDLDFHGWLFAYDSSNLQHRISVFNTTLNGWGGSIWQSGRAPAVDEQGNLYVVTGNGDYDGSSNFGESVLRLSGADSTLLDWYTPQEWSDYNTKDFDLGTTGAILVPNTNLVLAAAKSGTMYLIQRDSMGHLGPDNTNSVQGVQVNEWGLFHMALWNNQAGPIVYEFEPWGALKAFQIVNGRINATMLSQYVPRSSSFFAGIAVSANGGSNGTGIVWLTTGDSRAGSPGTLHALDASDLSHELWNSDMAPADAFGTAAKFAAATVVNGRVYIPTFSNALAIYGPLSPTSIHPAAPLTSRITSVVNGANFKPSAVSPGELVTIYGANIGPAQTINFQVDANNQVATSLSGTEVLFDGMRAPVLSTSATQVGAIVPFGLARPTTQVQVLYKGVPSPSMTVPVVPATPSLFSLDGTGAGPGTILNQDGSLNSVDHPAARDSVVILYGTGAGNTDPGGVDGKVFMDAPYPTPLLPVTVFIDNQPAEVIYAGAAPGMVAGVVQINVRVPSTASSGSEVPVVFKVGDYTSLNEVTLAIR
jgi:uncharacterized protein (TIGR03437 family)